MTDTDDTNEPGRIGAIASMQLEVAKLEHPAHAVDALRNDIRDRAAALGLEVVDVQLSRTGDDLTACATFDMRDDDGTPWQASFTRGAEHGS